MTEEKKASSISLSVQKNTEPTIEEKIKQVDLWIQDISEGRVTAEVSPELLREVLGVCGAEFNILVEAHRSLGKYTNKGKADGMRTVWKEHFDEYKEWTKRWIENYEEQTGNLLLALKKSGRKNSGMIQFFGELTAYAANDLSFENLKVYMEARVFNGQMWASGQKDKRKRVKLPTAEKPKLLSSIPPDFPNDAWGKIKEWGGTVS